MPTRDSLGGIVHTYQRYDPARIPPPRPPAADLVSPAMEHLLEYGNIDELTEEQLAEAMILDPDQIKGLGPSLDSIKRQLEERRRKLLERYETDGVRKKARGAFRDAAQNAKPPAKAREAFQKAIREEQLRQLERLWYAESNDQSRFAADLVTLIDRLGDVYQVDELAAKWQFTGREKLTVPEALEVKEELEMIEELLAQLEEARKNAKIALIDMEALGENTIVLDCDVLQADGGTRTAAITGAYLALADAIAWAKQQGHVKGDPLIDSVAAVSVGIIDGEPRLDLHYDDDVRAETDMNVVMTGSGTYVEVQGTAEGEPFDRRLLDQLLDLAAAGCVELTALQRAALAS